MGLNCLLRVYSQQPSYDDNVGGPFVTGSIVYEDVHARVEGLPAEMISLAQGMETDSVYYCLVHPFNLTIRNNYLVVVSSPSEHKLFNVPLKVIMVIPSSLNDVRGHLELILEHVDQSH